jgi:hypothetical protein
MKFPCKAKILICERYPHLVGIEMTVLGKCRFHTGWYNVEVPKSMIQNPNEGETWIAPPEALEFMEVKEA